MIWMIDEGGNATFRMRASLSLFGPQQQGVGADVVRLILGDLANQGIDVETTGTFTRVRRNPPPGSAETVWTGKLVKLSQLQAARDYFEQLAIDYHGSG